MKAHQLIDGASYGPEVIKVLCRAFDEAWDKIARTFGNDPSDIGRARLRLAEALLSVASEDARDVEVLKNAGLVAMALYDGKCRGVESSQARSPWRRAFTE